jgi:hypothetical protein
MNKQLITYSFNGGPLDQLLGQLIGGSREAKEELTLRSNVVVILGRSRNPRNYLRTDNGVFWQENNKLHRTFLYLKSSKVATYSLPKRHYFVCEKVRENLPYVMSNQDQVNVRCSETYKHYHDIQLDICGYCRSIFKEKTSMILTGSSFEEFILGMEEAEATRTKTTGRDGYVTNWHEISTAYRKTQGYTCEKCTLKIEQIEHQHFMHAHHINHDKRNNQRVNLQCLCIRCHSQVDELHRRNFAKPHQQRFIKEFNALYQR